MARMGEGLAWAAGFLDGDGCFSLTGRYPMISLAGGSVDSLERFHRVLQAGHVSGPYDRTHKDRWSTNPLYVLQIYKEAKRVAIDLWPHLSTAKKTRALEVLADFQPPADRSLANLWSFGRENLAWAAGFFDAEGCFSSTPRTGVCATITQTDREVLDRFRAIVSIGKVYGPYHTKQSDRFPRKPHFFYRAHGRERTQALLAMLWRWLGSAKKDQAIARLDWPTTCGRGHRKTPGHAACGECTREYWARYRAATPTDRLVMSKRARKPAGYLQNSSKAY